MGDIQTVDALRQRVRDYRRLRTMTMDKLALAAIDRVIAEAEAHLRRLEPIADQ